VDFVEKKSGGEFWMTKNPKNLILSYPIPKKTRNDFIKKAGNYCEFSLQANNR
jgi:hypothetical protein